MSLLEAKHAQVPHSVLITEMLLFPGHLHRPLLGLLWQFFVSCPGKSRTGHSTPVEVSSLLSRGGEILSFSLLPVLWLMQARTQLAEGRVAGSCSTCCPPKPPGSSLFLLLLSRLSLPGPYWYTGLVMPSQRNNSSFSTVGLREAPLIQLSSLYRSF